MDYTTLSEGDKLSLARDALRGLESDHFRTQVLVAQPNQAARLNQLELQIAGVREQIKVLEKAAAEEQRRIAEEAQQDQPEG